MGISWVRDTSYIYRHLYQIRFGSRRANHKKLIQICDPTTIFRLFLKVVAGNSSVYSGFSARGGTIDVVTSPVHVEQPTTMILVAQDFKSSGTAITWQLLRSKASALDAIEQGIRAVESNPED